MRKLNGFLMLFLLLLSPAPIQAADSSLSNIKNISSSPALFPNTVILLPDGSQDTVLQVLPNGDFSTVQGITISRDGVIRSGEFSGQTVTRSTMFPRTVITLPDKSRTDVVRSLPNGDVITDKNITISTEGEIRNGKFKGQTIDINEIFSSPDRLHINTVVPLPDGSNTVTIQSLPNGDFLTDQDITISREGFIRNGKYKGRKINIDETYSSPILPDTSFILPDGSRVLVTKTLADGSFLTDKGVTISSDGLIRDGKFAGKTAKLNSTRYKAEADVPGNKAQGSELLESRPSGKTEGKSGESDSASPDPDIDELAEILTSPIPGSSPEKTLADAENPVKKSSSGAGTNKAKAENGAASGKTRQESSSEGKGQGNGEDSGKKGDKASTGQNKAKAEKGMASGKTRQESSSEGKGSGKGQGSGEGKKTTQNSESKSASRATRAGDALRIPPDAAKTGSLAFLEGCWQGTRPEYYSKRTIKECFCFGANGKSGKRRIFDGPKRRCIGSTRANLKTNAVLSVTSSGAACNDGERWGGAEMVCRNSGPRTPCSWIFTDANNGRQAYEIPFVRVESCGR